MSRGFPAGFPPLPSTLTSDHAPPPPGISPTYPIFSDLPTQHTVQFSSSSSSMAISEGQGPHRSPLPQNLQRFSIIPSQGPHGSAEALMDLAPGTSMSTSNVAERGYWNGQDLSFPVNLENRSFQLNGMEPRFPPKAIDLSFPRTTNDVKRLIVKLRELISQANQTANDILKSGKINHDALPMICVEPRNDNRHLRRITKDAIDRNAILDATDSFSKANKIFSGFYGNLKSKKDLSNAFFYDDAPAVVQMQDYIDVSSNENIALPEFAMGEIWTELVPCKVLERDSCAGSDVLPVTLLPSQLCSLDKEIDRWKILPSMLSPIHLEVMHNLRRVRTRDLRRFLLMHLPFYATVPYKRKHVDHILFLLVFCLRAVNRRADSCMLKSGLNGGMREKNEQKETSGVESQVVECRVLLDSSNWFSSKLSLLCFPEATKNLVLTCYKHALKCAIRCILAMSQKACSDTNLGSKDSVVSDKQRFSQDLNGSRFENDKERIILLELAREEPGSLRVVDSMTADNVVKKPENPNISTDDDDDYNGIFFVGEFPLSLCQFTDSIVVLEELAASQKRIKSDSEFFSSSPYHRSVLHKMIVEQAEGLRATRINYRPVLEHDGLMWQKPQNQDSNRKKTKEEILAEERDYKRRRMSYRAKKVKRTPMQVIRDIIESHMADIVASGGIGCVGRKAQDMPPSHESSGRVKHSNERADSSYKDRHRQDAYHGESHGSNSAMYKPDTEYN